MHLLPVGVVTPLRFNFVVVLVTTLLLMAGEALFAADVDPLPQPDKINLPASVTRYSEIAPQSEEAVVDLLNRVSQYAETGELFDDPIVIMLHGVEARVFARNNYKMYQPTVDLARQLDERGVIEVQICEVWMSINGVSAEEIPDFIDPVPYGAAVIEEMIESGSVVF